MHFGWGHFCSNCGIYIYQGGRLCRQTQIWKRVPSLYLEKNKLCFKLWISIVRTLYVDRLDFCFDWLLSDIKFREGSGSEKMCNVVASTSYAASQHPSGTKVRPDELSVSSGESMWKRQRLMFPGCSKQNCLFSSGRCCSCCFDGYWQEGRSEMKYRGSKPKNNWWWSKRRWEGQTLWRRVP